MSNFPIVATVLSMVLGLSFTRLLLSLVTIFRIRRTYAADWVPLTWAGILFLMQLQFWWAINQLPSVRAAISFPEFVFLVLLTMTLFMSAALLLPSRSEDEQLGLRFYFEMDGRYALASMSSFLALGFIANLVFFEEPLTSMASIADVPMIVLPVVAFLARQRRIYAAITLLYLPLSFLDMFISLTSS